MTTQVEMFYFYDVLRELYFKSAKEKKMISKEKKYILRQDINVPEKERTMVEILALDMGGKEPVLVRIKPNTTSLWLTLRYCANGSYLSNGVNHRYDLFELKPEEWYCVYFPDVDRFDTPCIAMVASNGLIQKSTVCFPSKLEAQNAMKGENYPLDRCVFIKKPFGI